MKRLGWHLKQLFKFIGAVRAPSLITDAQKDATNHLYSRDSNNISNHWAVFAPIDDSTIAPS